MSRLARAVAVCAIAAAVPACGSSGAGSTASTPSGHSHEATPGWDQFSTPQFSDGSCSHKYPGELMTAAEAIVSFSPAGICPGYVTVKPDTAVTWKNLDTKPHTVTVRKETPDGDVVKEITVDPGKTWASRFAEGKYAYATDAIDSFRGWVEVTTQPGVSGLTGG